MLWIIGICGLFAYEAITIARDVHASKNKGRTGDLQNTESFTEHEIRGDDGVAERAGKTAALPVEQPHHDIQQENDGNAECCLDQQPDVVHGGEILFIAE